MSYGGAPLPSWRGSARHGRHTRSGGLCGGGGVRNNTGVGDAVIPGCGRGGGGGTHSWWRGGDGSVRAREVVHTHLGVCGQGAGGRSVAVTMAWHGRVWGAMP